MGLCWCCNSPCLSPAHMSQHSKQECACRCLRLHACTLCRTPSLDRKRTSMRAISQALQGSPASVASWVSVTPAINANAHYCWSHLGMCEQKLNHAAQVLATGSDSSAQLVTLHDRLFVLADYGLKCLSHSVEGTCRYKIPLSEVYQTQSEGTAACTSSRVRFVLENPAGFSPQRSIPRTEVSR